MNRKILSKKATVGRLFAYLHKIWYNISIVTIIIPLATLQYRNWNKIIFRRNRKCSRLAYSILLGEKKRDV